jgi:hypothetical protein
VRYFDGLMLPDGVEAAYLVDSRSVRFRYGPNPEAVLELEDRDCWGAQRELQARLNEWVASIREYEERSVS